MASAGRVISKVVPPPVGVFQIDILQAQTWFRVHDFDPATQRYEPHAFNDSGLGNARFSPLRDPAGKLIPTIYAASTPLGAIAEIVLHDAPTPSVGYILPWSTIKTGKLHISDIAAPALNLVDLTSMGLRAAGLHPHDLFAGEKPDYPRTRDWALYVWANVPAAQGLVWMSVRDNTSQAIMLFGDRLPAKAVQWAGMLEPILVVENEVDLLLKKLGAGRA